MLRSYLVLAWKVLSRRRMFTAISLFGIAFTLTVLIVASAMLDHSFSTRPPETRLGRTLGIYYMELRGEHMVHTSPPGYALLDRYMRDLPGVELTSLFSTPQTVSSYLGGQRVRSYLKRTDGAFWQILDFDFLEGGPFTAQDEAQGNPVAVINVSTRARFFGAGATAVGQEFTVDDQRFRVVGVVPDVPVLRQVPFADVWVPLSTSKSSAYKNDLEGAGFLAIFLAKSRADFPTIKAAVQERLARVQLPSDHFTVARSGADTLFEAAARSTLGDHQGTTASSAEITDPGQSEARTGALFALILGLGLLFMLLPALNLANINLSRILERTSEIGVRKAFGASSRALVGQFLVENVVLTMVGGLIGLLGGAIGLVIVNRSGLIPYADFSLNWRVFLYGLVAALVFGLLSGVYPAWRMSRLDPVQALRGRS
jgi:putative ABC transport system permease protein